MTGDLARSKAGHDKGKIYVIIDEDDEYVYLADGVLKKTDHPKKKKKKHVQLIYYRKQFEISNQNEAVKRAIKLYNKEENPLPAKACSYFSSKNKEDSQCRKRM